MKPYDRSNSFMRRVTKRVSQLIPGTTWMSTLLGEVHSPDDPISASENDDQPPVKKLCTSNNTFSATNNRTCVETSPSINLPDNHRNAHVNTSLPEISAIHCVPSTSKQSPKFVTQSNSSSFNYDISNRSSLKRKSDVIDISKINRTSPKTLAVNFVSSTPTLAAANIQPTTTNILKRSLNSDTVTTSNEILIPTSSKQTKSRENETQSILKYCETTKNTSSPSFRWDTFVNYGELSERQKLFAQRSPLNCSQVMYGGSSARSNLSKLLGNAPPIHRKTVIPISPTNNSEIRTTSSILLGHISTKDKEIKENTFIIQPKVPVTHKINHKPVPLKIETTVKIDTTPEKIDDKSNANLSIGFQSRKLKTNVLKKARGVQSEELEMPVKVNLPNISLSVPVLPNIQFSNTNVEDTEFTFNQPLTLEQYSSQIIDKNSKKKKKNPVLKKLQNTNLSSKVNSSSTVVKPLINVSRETKKVSIAKKDERPKNLNKSGTVSMKFRNDLKDTHTKCIQKSSSKLESKKPIDNSPKVLELNNKKQLLNTNDKDKINCVEHKTSLSDNSEKPIKVSQSSTWTCDTCWVPNKKEIDVCVACQTQKAGTTKKIVEQSTWTCDACWVKNKSECVSCISCGTAKPGSAPENKTQPQFSFGLNNNAFAKSSGSQFKFGLDNTNQSPPSDFKFVMPTTLKAYKNGKSAEASTTEFKFGGMVNNKTEQPLGTFKFGIDSATIQPKKKDCEVSNINIDQQPLPQFKLDNGGKPDQPDSKLNFGLNSTTSKPITKFQFNSDKTKTDNSVQENLAADSNVDTQNSNEFQSLVNNTNDFIKKSIELQSNSSEFKFGDSKPISQATFSFVETNTSSKVKNEDSSKYDKVKIETNPFNSVVPQTIPSTTGSTIQLVNGHSHANETSTENLKPGLIKTSQLFTFGSLAKQDQNLPDDQKQPKTFTFGSTNDIKPFVVAPTLATSSFSTTGTMFGLNNNNTVFGSGTTTSTPTSLSTSVSTSQFSFGLMSPSTSSGFFTKTTKENDKKPTPFTSTTLGGFSFGQQSTPQPVFSVPIVGGLKPAQVEDKTNSAPNNIFSQSSTKHPLKLDPNAPLTSINFTGGATTQFTAKPETTEQKPQRKILKPVRRIR